MSWRFTHPMGGADWIAGLGPILPCYLTRSKAEIDMLGMDAHDHDHPRIVAKLLIDTGASNSCLSLNLLQTVGARPRRPGSFTTVDHKIFHTTIYRAAIDVTSDGPNGVMERFSVDFAALPEPAHDAPYAGVLGRDFLRGKQFVYDGVTGKFGVRIGGVPQL